MLKNKRWMSSHITAAGLLFYIYKITNNILFGFFYLGSLKSPYLLGFSTEVNADCTQILHHNHVTKRRNHAE